MKKIFLLFLTLITFGYGNTQKVVKVAVIDTGLDFNHPMFNNKICPSGHKDFTHTDLYDTNGHGTHVAGLIVQNTKIKNYCILVYKYFDNRAPGSVNTKNMVSSIREAIQQGASVINISGGGPEFYEEEYLLIQNNPQVKFIVAAGNDGKDLSVTTWFNKYKFYPASYGLPNVIIVGALNAQGDVLNTSNRGYTGMVWERGEYLHSALPGASYGYMTGTSSATAVHTGKYLTTISKE